MQKYQVNLPNGEKFIFELEKGDYVIDCGANVGDVTNFFQQIGAKVFAFEPNRHAFEVLSQRYQNNINVVCINKGVGAESDSGMKKLFLHENADHDQVVYSTGCSIVDDKVNVNTENYEKVEIVDLSKYIKSLDKPVKVLKIDIEGAEINLLNDLLDKGILRNIPYVFVETHEKKIPSLRKPTEMLKQRISKEGYSNINLNWI